jgi:NAD(P)-dependent dehydrogenase (short-subunit alcohol dehydrogenase family)
VRRTRYEVAGRTVFITGAARGIGAAVAARLHGNGANVALVGLEAERLEELAARLGPRAAPFEADVVDGDALARAVAGTVERFGGIDVAIANAGIHFIGALASSPPEQVDRVLAVNLSGVWRTDRAVLPHLAERRGYLLNIASLAAASHAPLMGPYAASKAGVEALTDCLRVELASYGVSVGCGYFGFIDTDLVRRSFEHPSTKAIERVIPAWLRRPAPLATAVDAVERGIERRARRLWAPRYVGAALVLRGVIQPWTERRAIRDPGLAESIRLAAPEAGGALPPDPLLGIALERAGEPVRADARTDAATLE